MSSRSPGGRFPGPAEVHLPSAGWKQQTFRHIQGRQRQETPEAQSKDSDTSRDLQDHEVHRSTQLSPLHPSEGRHCSSF